MTDNHNTNLLQALLTPRHPEAAHLLRGLLRADADLATLQAAATLITANLRNQAPHQGASHLPEPSTSTPGWCWAAAFERARLDLAEEADESGVLRDRYHAPETAYDAADTCAMIAAQAAARDWRHDHGARDGETPAGKALTLASEQAAYDAAMACADQAARDARDPADRPLEPWERELLGLGDDADRYGPRTQPAAREWTSRLYAAARAALDALAPADGVGAQPWLVRVRDADRAIEDGRRLMEAGADERSVAIADGVASWRRGGRAEVAGLLGVQVLAVDRALARAVGKRG